MKRRVVKIGEEYYPQFRMFGFWFNYCLDDPYKEEAAAIKLMERLDAAENKKKKPVGAVVWKNYTESVGILPKP